MTRQQDNYAQLERNQAIELENLRGQLRRLVATPEYAYAMGHGCSIGDHPVHRECRARAERLRARIGELAA